MDDLHAGGRYYPVVTDTDYPGGMSCPVCDRIINNDQPFAQVLLAGGLGDGDEIVIDVCVYCTGRPVPHA